MAVEKRLFAIIASFNSKETLGKKRCLREALETLARTPPTALISGVQVSAYAIAVELNAEQLLAGVMDAIPMLTRTVRVNTGRLPIDEIVVVEMGAEHAAADKATEAALGIFTEKYGQ